eukprot:1969690-Pyramimonas_sp.AAC.1
MAHAVRDRLTTCHPQFAGRLWLGDLSQVAVGPRRHVIEVLEEGVVATQELLEEQSLRLAPKSIIACARIADAKLILERL